MLPAGIAYAVGQPVVVMGDQCMMRTTQPWNESLGSTLENQCPHRLLIEAIVNTCMVPGVVPGQAPCVAGQTLPGGATCQLPYCDL
jgi:hypothetical protein